MTAVAAAVYGGYRWAPRGPRAATTPAAVHGPVAVAPPAATRITTRPPDRGDAAHLARLLADPDPAARAAAVRALADLGPDAVPALLAALAAPTGLARSAATAALRELGSVAAAPALARALADPDPRVRQRAARAAEILGPAPAGSPLEPALVAALADPDPRVRRDAALALAATGPRSPAAVARLLAALTDPDAGVRVAAAAAAATLPAAATPDLVPTLVRDLESPDRYRHLPAVSALARLGPRAAAALPALLAAFRTGDPALQTEIRILLEGLRPVGAATFPSLAVALRDPELKPLAPEILEILRDSGPAAADALPALIESARGEPLGVRLRSLLMTIARVSPAGTDTLLGLLADPDPNLRLDVAMSTVEFDGPDLHLTLKALQDADPRVRAASLRALPDLGIPADPALRRALAGPDRAAQLAAAGALWSGAGGEARSESLILDGLVDPQSEVRRCAARALDSAANNGAALSDTMRAVLASSLGDSDAEVRTAAAAALLRGKSPPDQALAVLLDTLAGAEPGPANLARTELLALARTNGHAWYRIAAELAAPDPARRHAVACVLAANNRLDPPEPLLPVLVAAARDPDPEVRRAALHALRETDDPPHEILPAVLDALDHGEAASADVAVKLLRRLRVTDDETLPALGQAVRTGSLEAVQLLRETGPRGRRILLDAVLEAADPKVRDSAFRQDWAGELEPDDAGHLVAALADDGKRAGVERVLREMGGRAVPALSAGLTSGDRACVRGCAALLRGWPRCDPDTITAVVEAIPTAELMSQVDLAETLIVNGVHPEIWRPTILQCTRACEPEVRASALWVFYNQATRDLPENQAALLRALSDPNGDVREVASIIATRYQETLPLDALRTALGGLTRDPDPRPRAYALFGLVEIGPPAGSTTDLLLDALRDPDRRIRSGAAERLANGDPTAAEAAPILLENVRRCINRESVFSAECLGPELRALNCMGAVALPAIQAALQQPDSHLREAAARVLERMASPPEDSLSWLTTALNDPEEEVRLAAMDALGRLGRKVPAALPGVRAALNGALAGSAGWERWRLKLELQDLPDPSAAAPGDRR